MRAMILAAGLGSRLRPLTEFRAKPALPVRGRPVISLLLQFLAHHGIREVMINLHHLPETIRAAVARDRPEGLAISWSEETRPLGTGGGIRRAAEFLRGSPSCVVLAGDMLVDFDLGALAERHLTSGLGCSLLLREDPRGLDFGTIGADAQGHVSRIGERRVEAGARATKPGRGKVGVEMSRGLFTGVRFFSRETLGHWPLEEVFEDLRDWLLPGIERRGQPVGALVVGERESRWEPVGTLAEYLRANLEPPSLPSLGGDVEAWGGDVELLGENRDAVVDRRAYLPNDARLERSIVWDGERVQAGFSGHDGVFAGGRFHSCLERGRAGDDRERADHSDRDHDDASIPYGALRDTGILH
ncbi:MAG: hypothetical protein CL908_00295 [Deltaproteobacteria bacterium]|nr:hypothetical protein [Deltaproteobacteria bacterium]